MKLFKPFLFSAIFGGVDFGYRTYRQLHPDQFLFLISFTVFFTIFIVLTDHETI